MSKLQTISIRIPEPIRVSVTVLLLLIACFYSRAQETDSLFFRFSLGSTDVDLSYSGNGARLQQFEEQFKQQYAGRNPAGIQIDVYAGASPEGSRNRNMELGQARAESIAALLRERLGEQAGTIELHNLGPRWDDFYNLVAASDEPWRDEVLSILRRDYAADPRYLDPREMHLRALRDGEVWPVLLKRYLAPLRSGGGAGVAGGAPVGSAGTVVVSWHPERDTVVIRDTVFVAPPAVAPDTVVVVVPVMAPDTVFVHEPSAPRERDTIVIIHDYVAPVRVKKEPEKQDQTPAMAIKTNLALWGVVAPNLEVEFPLGRSNRWSLEAEVFAPWFIWNKNARASEFLNVGVEGRYWLGDRQYHRCLDGWHLGLALAGGYYDWEWKQSDGYQGEYLNLYFNIGWQHRFGKNWAVDLGVGVGAMGTQYRHYYGGSVYPEGREEPWDEHLIWHDTGYFLWPGPCHVNFSIVYLINFKDKKTHKK